MNLKIKKLKEERASMIEKMQSILDKADAEGRELNKEEIKLYDSLDEGIGAKQAAAEREERLEDLNKEQAEQQHEKRGNKLEVEKETEWRNQRGNKAKVIKVGATYGSNESEVRFSDIIRAMAFGPENEAERRALESSTGSAGYTIPIALLNQFIDLARAKSRVVQAGATFLGLSTNDNTIVKVLSDPTVSWTSELGAVTASDPTFGRVRFQPETLTALVKISREALEDSLNVESILKNAFAQAFSLKWDQAALLGTGTPPEPEGIFNYTSVNTYSMGTNGATLASQGYAPIVKAIRLMLDNNSNGATAGIMAPRTWEELGLLVDTTGQPLMPPSIIKDLPLLETTSIPVNQTQGTATDASTIILGDFTQLMIGIRSELRIEFIKERYIDNNTLAFFAHMRLDMKPARENHFAKIVGIIPA